MRKKTILYLIANIPFTYLLFIIFGWASYFLTGGNPTFFIPFKTLLLIFFILTVLIAIGFINLLKIFSTSTLLITILEISVMYMVFLTLLH
jgi:hypothetical protein